MHVILARICQFKHMRTCSVFRLCERIYEIYEYMKVYMKELKRNGLVVLQKKIS